MRTSGFEGDARPQRARVWPWVFAVALAASVAFGLVLQRQRTALLRSEIDALRTQQRDAERIRAENARFAAERLSAEALGALRREREEAAAVRREIEAAKQAEARLAADKGGPVRKLDSTVTAPVQISLPAKALDQDLIPETGWKNVGRSTPAAALETALWAAAGGDLDALAPMLILAGNARANAEALLAGMPAETRALYATPEHLIAALTTKDVPAGGASIVQTIGKVPEEKILVLNLRPQRDKAEFKFASIVVRASPAGWQLVVPESAVARYGAMLKGEAPAGAAASVRTKAGAGGG